MSKHSVLFALTMYQVRSPPKSSQDLGENIAEQRHSQEGAGIFNVQNYFSALRSLESKSPDFQIHAGSSLTLIAFRQRFYFFSFLILLRMEKK